MSYDEKTYWESRYVSNFHSGEGSRGLELEQKLQFIRKHLSCKSSVLDLGHGDGELSFCLKDAILSYQGFDISQTAVETCRTRALTDKLFNFYFECCDIADVQGHVVDVVLCIDVLFHMPSREKFNCVVENICDQFSECAVITVWKPSIVSARKGKFASHNNFFDLELPSGVFIHDQLDLVDSPHKQILCLKRTPSVK